MHFCDGRACMSLPILTQLRDAVRAWGSPCLEVWLFLLHQKKQRWETLCSWWPGAAQPLWPSAVTSRAAHPRLVWTDGAPSQGPVGSAALGCPTSGARLGWVEGRRAHSALMRTQVDLYHLLSGWTTVVQGGQSQASWDGPAPPHQPICGAHTYLSWPHGAHQGWDGDGRIWGQQKLERGGPHGKSVLWANARHWVGQWVHALVGVDDVQGGHRCVVQGGGCKLDLVVGQLQGRVDPYSPACQLEAPGSDIWVAQPGAEQGGVQHRHT